MRDAEARRAEVVAFRRVMGGSDSGSRTRPGGHPNPEISALRALRKATRDYLIVLDAGLAALTNEAIEGNPELAYIRSMLAVATGRRGWGGFGTPIGIERGLSRALGEEEAT